MNPILLDFPDHFETERLLIRAPRPGDGAALNAAIKESIEELKVWMPWAQTVPTPDESEIKVREFSASWIARTDLYLFMFEKNGGFVGSSGLHRIDWEVPRFEIGYWQRTSSCGRGLVNEAVGGITRFCFDHLNANRVEIRCAAANIKSAAVAVRAGFPLEATLKNWIRRPDGEMHDTLVFAKTAPDSL